MAVMTLCLGFKPRQRLIYAIENMYIVENDDTNA